MLESVVEKLPPLLRSTASKLASRHACFVTSTLDVLLSDFPIFPSQDSEGLAHDFAFVTALALSDYLSYRGVVEFVAGKDPYYIIGVTASGRQRLLILPNVVSIPIDGESGNSKGFLSAVGIYALRPPRGKARSGSHLSSLPYTER